MILLGIFLAVVLFDTLLCAINYRWSVHVHGMMCKKDFYY